MSAKLKNLEVTKVDFVDAGDNKGAHVVLFKRADNPAGNQKGATTNMDTTTNMNPTTDTVTIDKSKLTPEELETLKAIEKKAGIPDAPPVSGGTVPASGQEPASALKNTPDTTVTKTGPDSVEPVAKKEPLSGVPAPDSSGDDEIYKGIHPLVRQELERLKRRADEADERELFAVAKKYELLGKKPEELVPTLKSLKAAGGGAYEQMISVLDASLEVVEKSELFGEIGRTGVAGAAAGTDAWSQIRKHAQTMMTADPGLNLNEAIDKACEAHPELVREYEENR